MDSLITIAISAIILGFFLFTYLRSLKKRDAAAQAAEEKGKLHSAAPHAQHPHIDMTYCIGCGGCTSVCPEGDVLALLGGKAVIVNGHKCIGHSLCAEACPVGAITMVTASANVAADMPYLTTECETSISNLFIAGELGGLALIKNAVNQGRDCVDVITSRVTGSGKSDPDIYDVLIVGAGPAGISASLRAIENKLKYLTVEQDEIGGTVAKYPRQKLVMTSPVQFPMYGKFKKTGLSKEELIAFWNNVMRRADFKVRIGEKVQHIQKAEDGVFTVVTSNSQERARAVVLAIGKAGTPRKLGVKGEELPKVMYRLIEADHYINKRILVVGGGDSAVEAAMGLAHQAGNKVTLSYRKEAFSRIKERNTQRIQECMRTGKVKVIFNSAPLEITQDAVVLEVNGKKEEIPNDYVWVFAGGEPPTAFLKQIGVGFGMQDMTLKGSAEAKQAKKELAELRRGVRADDPPTEKAMAQTRLGVQGEDLPKVAYQLSDAQGYEDKDILVVGASDLAIRAARALGHAGRNRVTLICGDSVSPPVSVGGGRLMETLEEEKHVRTLKNGTVAAITPDSVIVRVGADVTEIPNDNVFILFADGLPRAAAAAAVASTGYRARACRFPS